MKLRAMFTIDVEDWYHSNFSQLDGQEQSLAATAREKRYAMDRNVDRLIELLGSSGGTCTCFVLGEFAERFPKSIQKLHGAGFEMATHLYHHVLATRLTREEFREELVRGMGVVQSLTGERCVGFRAPSWSVSDEETPWAMEVLAEQGIRYDSSDFPIWTPLYGGWNRPTYPYMQDGVVRIPVTIYKVGPLRVPFSTGAFLRLTPLSMIRFGFWMAQRQGLPLQAMAHPREFALDQPRLPLTGFQKFLQYANMGTVESKLEALFRELEWVSMGSVAEGLRKQLTG